MGTSLFRAAIISADVPAAGALDVAPSTASSAARAVRSPATCPRDMLFIKRTPVGRVDEGIKVGGETTYRRRLEVDVELTLLEEHPHNVRVPRVRGYQQRILAVLRSSGMRCGSSVRDLRGDFVGGGAGGSERVAQHAGQTQAIKCEFGKAAHTDT